MFEQNRSNFQLSPSTHKVVCSGKGGLYATDLHSQFQSIFPSLQPHLVILDVGTNDLDSGLLPTEVASQVYSFAINVLNNFPVNHVVILEVLDRAPTGKYAPRNGSFSTYVKIYNQTIKSYINGKQQPLPGVHFWHHKRMSTCPEQYIADGVHLNAKGLSKYFYSVKRAIVKFSV